MSSHKRRTLPKSHPLKTLFDGGLGTWNATVDRPKWVALKERWRGYGLADDVQMMCRDLVSLRVERQKHEDRLLHAFDLIRVKGADRVGRPAKRPKPTPEAKTERKVYEAALNDLRRRLEGIRAEGRKEPRDLVEAAEALRTLMLHVPASPRLPGGNPGSTWARPGSSGSREPCSAAACRGSER